MTSVLVATWQPRLCREHCSCAESSKVNSPAQQLYEHSSCIIIMSISKDSTELYIVLHQLVKVSLQRLSWPYYSATILSQNSL